MVGWLASVGPTAEGFDKAGLGLLVGPGAGSAAVLFEHAPNVAAIPTPPASQSSRRRLTASDRLPGPPFAGAFMASPYG
ncbi:PPE family C-terminal domain-containing protein [Mycobacterium intermedium]|nr:hypothetical protein BV508_15685 [Mycobacterium intermedium]